MRDKFKSGGLLAAFFSMCVVAATAGASGPGCSSQPAEAANTKAAADTLTTVKPQLDAVATAHPDRAAAVASLEAQWTTQSERADYAAAVPLLKIREQDAPGLADALESKIKSWDQRLTAMGQ